MKTSVKTSGEFAEIEMERHGKIRTFRRFKQGQNINWFEMVETTVYVDDKPVKTMVPVSVKRWSKFGKKVEAAYRQAAEIPVRRYRRNEEPAKVRGIKPGEKRRGRRPKAVEEN